mgnify:CR=1 FL=1
MELISTHICKGQNIGVHGNLFGGTMLAWLDEAGAAFACQACDTPRMVTVKVAEVQFRKPVRPGQIIKIYDMTSSKRIRALALAVTMAEIMKRRRRFARSAKTRWVLKMVPTTNPTWTARETALRERR